MLGSYVVQAELGDYEHDDHGVGVSYMKNVHFAPHQPDDLLEKVAELHRSHRWGGFFIYWSFGFALEEFFMLVAVCLVTTSSWVLIRHLCLALTET